MSDEEVLYAIALGRYEMRLEYRATAQCFYVMRAPDDKLWVGIFSRISGQVEVVSLARFHSRMGRQMGYARINRLFYSLASFYQVREGEKAYGV